MSSYDDYLTALGAMDARQRTHWEEAELVLNQPDYETPVTGRLDIGGFSTAEIVESHQCIHWWQRGPAWPFEQCPRPAGHRTNHEGVGLCWEHGGHFGKGAVQGAVMMAHAYADELDVSPWQALMSQVRLLSAQVSWLRARVLDAELQKGVNALKPGSDDYPWVAMLEARGERLAKVAKMAIDAGVAERFVRQLELEGEMMMTAAVHALDSIGITGEARETALASMAEKLLELETGQALSALAPLPGIDYAKIPDNKERQT